MPFDHHLAGQRDQVGIVEQRGLRLEDRRLARAKAAGGVIDQRHHLRAGAHQSIVEQRRPWPDRPAYR
jgi:hypothetical protein